MSEPQASRPEIIENTEVLALPEPQTTAPEALPTEDAMEDLAPNAPQPEPNLADTLLPAAPLRRKRTFPVRFRVRKDEHGKVVESRMYYAHEWEELMAKEAAEAKARQEAEDAAREAELAAGRADFPNRENHAPKEPPFDHATSVARSTLVASAPIIHSIGPIPPDYDRHSRLCAICSHPDRDAIEGDFVRWRKTREIIDDYGLSSRSAFYRHVHAVGLFQRRRFELARVLETRLEEAEDCPLEHFDVITRAIRAYAHLGDDGRWFEPPRTHHVLTGSLAAPRASKPPHAPGHPGASPDPPPAIDISLNLPNPK